MAAAVMGRTEVGLREVGTTVSVPNSPKAKLMYYLNCMCAVLDLSDQTNLGKLRNCGMYSTLSEEETDLLVSLCFLMSPDTLNGKVIFQDEAVCGDKNNQFFELSAVRTNLLISESIMIGGQRRAVHKIMAYKPQWILTFWVDPMRYFQSRLARLVTGQPTQQQRPAIAYPTGQSTQQQRPAIAYPTGQPSRQQRPAIRSTYTKPNRSTYNSSRSSSCCSCTIL